MIDGEQLFREIKLNGKPLSECTLEIECNDGNYRLYAIREEKSFYAMAVEFCTCGAGYGSIWDAPDLVVNELFQATAFHDGVRHFGVNREAGDLAGYIYYPNMGEMIKLLQKIREIELEVCPNVEK